MTVSFQQVPPTKRLPGTAIEFDSSRAQSGLPGMPQRALSIGQRSGGLAPSLEPQLTTDPEQSAVNFGRGSMLHQQAVAFFEANDHTEYWQSAVDDAEAGTKSVKSVMFGKSVPDDDYGAGTVNLYVGGTRVRAGVSAESTAAEIVAALVAAAQANPMVPAVLSVAPEAGKLLVTAKNKGEAAGNIDVRLNYDASERSPLNLTAIIEEDTAGSGNPEIGDALAAADGAWWTQVQLPYLDGTNYQAMHDWLSERYGAQSMRDGIAFGVRPGTVAELVTAGEAVNSPHIVTPPHEKSPRVAWVLSAALMGIAAVQAALDPARQLRSLEINGWMVPAVGDRFSARERELLLRSGISALDYDTGVTRVARLITNYQLSPAGAEDEAYLDLTTLTVLAYLRWSESERILKRFPRHKLANDGTRFGPGQAVVTPQTIRGELVSLYREWEFNGLVESADFFAERLIVERAEGDPNRINSLQTPDIINNFRIFAAVIQFRL